MITINDEDFDIKLLDDKKTITRRIAQNFQTLPKYLYGLPDVYENGDNIDVEDLLETIKQHAEKGDDFSLLWNEYSDIFEALNLDLEEDVFKYYIVFNKNLNDMQKAGLDEYINSIYLLINQDLKENNIFDKKKNIEEIWDFRNAIRKDLNNSINHNADLAKKDLEYLNQVESLPPLKTTTLDVEEINFTINLELDFDSILDIFNEIQLNENIIIATVNNFYKIYKTFVPSKDQIEQWQHSFNFFNQYFPDNIILKIFQNNKYIDVIIKKEGDDIKVYSKLIIEKNGINEKYFKDIILSIFPNIKSKRLHNLEEQEIKGSFYFPNLSFNIYILADLIMNNNIFSSMLAVNEYDKTSKSKSNLYLHFKNANINRLTANITSKEIAKGDPLLRGKHGLLFKIGSKYVRILIGYAKNRKDIEEFREIFSKLMSLYVKLEPQILKIYKYFIPNFNNDKKIDAKEDKIDDELRLKDIEPLVFISGYSKRCNDKPRIISDEEAEFLEEEGVQVLRYPQSIEEGFIPRNYVCDHHDDAIYPGLRKNPLDNKDIVPYLPCCFKKNQLDKKDSITKAYLSGEELIDDVKAQQGIIKSNKFMEHNYFATIPEDVKHIIEIFDQDLDSVYLRKGMTNTQNSFLECVMEAMNVTIKKRSLLDQTRMKFNNNKCASCCKQEMYDFTIEEIIEYINDTSRYFSPNYFINLLECVFKCNIFIFDRNSMNSPITKLIIPRHKQSYYKRNKKGPCIFIYQHMGSLGNSVKDLPIKCELIVKKKKSDPDYIQKIFPESDILSKNINSIFNELNLTYSLYRINLNNIIPTELYELMLSQYIDSYGKTRILVINYNGIKLYLQTSPLQPFLLNSVHSSYVEPTEANIAKEFIKEYGVFDVKQIIYQKNVVAYEGVLGNVKIIIPILKTYPTIDLLQINVNNIPYNINKKESI